MYRWVIAWRWLKRLPILWVSVVGVLLGVASILVVDSIFNGVLRELKRIYRGSSSDIVVLTPVPTRGGRPDPLPTQEMVKSLLGVPGVAAASPRLRRPCILPKEMRLPEVVAIGAISRQSLIELVGIVPQQEYTVSELLRFLQQAPADKRVHDFAHPFDVSDLPDGGVRAGEGPMIPILLGERCAEALHLSRGSAFELLTLGDIDPQEAHDRGVHPCSGWFVVAGTFATHSFLEDLQRAYVPVDRLQSFAKTASDATEIAVKASPDADLMALRMSVEHRLAPFDIKRMLERPVLLWEDLEKKTLLAIDNQREVLDFVLFFIVLVAGFNLLVSLHLLVSEKIKDVGTLASMGGSAFGIASVFTALGTLVTVLGAGLGLASGFLLAQNINAAHDVLSRWLGKRLWDADVYLFDQIPVDFEPRIIGLALIATFAVTLLFAFLASLRAARLDPVEALRQE
jgi:lipoprotein-releasing system permease protein